MGGSPEPLHATGHPQVVTVLKPWNGRPQEAYSRALLFQPHGIALYNPYSNWHCSAGYLQHGVSIGDVGYMDADFGGFVFCFNIFLPQDHPDQWYAPDYFQPFSQPLDNDGSNNTRIIADFHKPGTIITSGGVKTTVTSKEPLQASFFSTEPEAAVLVLPRGASREDLISSDHLHSYIKRHAEYWYQFRNPNSVTTPNGGLLLVTGYDKTDRYALATGIRGRGPTMNLKYVQRPDLDEPWVDTGDCHVAWNKDRAEPSKHGANTLCVFLRGIHISLGINSWASSQPQGDLSHNGFYTIIRHAPRTSVYLEKITSTLRIGISEEVAQYRSNHRSHCICTPNTFLAEILLSRYPTAELVLMDDHVWLSEIKEGQPCTVTHMNKLVARVFETSSASFQDGIVTFTQNDVKTGNIEQKFDPRGRPESIKYIRLTEFVSIMGAFRAQTNLL